MDLKVEFNERGNGYAYLFYKGVEVGTLFLLGHENCQNEQLLAELICIVNGLPAGNEVQIARWLHHKAVALKHQSELRDMKDPFEEVEKGAQKNDGEQTGIRAVQPA
jgi:hypothetical protein